MRAQDIVLGEYYRHKDHPNFCWAKAVKVLKPRQEENTHSYTIVKCEWSTDKSGWVSLTKYFRPTDLVKG